MVEIAEKANKTTTVAVVLPISCAGVIPTRQLKPEPGSDNLSLMIYKDSNTNAPTIIVASIMRMSFTEMVFSLLFDAAYVLMKGILNSLGYIIGFKNPPNIYKY